MPRRNFINRLARRNHQHLYRRQARRGMTELIQAFQQLDVAFQAVNERAVEHMPADLGQGRFLAGEAALHRRLIAPWVAADAHHQHAAGAQVQGRADRC